MSIGQNPAPKMNAADYWVVDLNLEKKILLSKPVGVEDRSFFQVIEERVSERHFAILTLEQLGNLLWYSAKARQAKVANNGQILSHRPSPSAGAIHPVDLIISLPEQIHRREFYLYNSIDHSLNLIKLEYSFKNNFLNNLNECLDMSNATVIWFAECVEKCSARYHNYESLVFRDSGALLMLIQMVSTALKIKSCPIGTLGEPFFTNLFSGKSHIQNGGGMYVG